MHLNDYMTGIAVVVALSYLSKRRKTQLFQLKVSHCAHNVLVAFNEYIQHTNGCIWRLKPLSKLWLKGVFHLLSHCY